MTLSVVQREFLFCIQPDSIVPALARSGVGVDELLPGGDRSRGGPIESSWVAAKNGWEPTGDGPARRYRIWNANGARLELKSGPWGDILAIVTRSQLRAYARSLPYPLVAELRALVTRGPERTTSTGFSRRHSISPGPTSSRGADAVVTETITTRVPVAAEIKRAANPHRPPARHCPECGETPASRVVRCPTCRTTRGVSHGA
ncbi:hypothetical protein GS453_14655 [Rhodococcus hoagii]|uniref:Uncharacterized protein n=1 Tax=Rhodococcus hoagii TaxID=43767 RepID=A0AAP2ANS3_RHOHA|nr:hypothetical protein [Prescottella equi]